MLGPPGAGRSRRKPPPRLNPPPPRRKSRRGGRLLCTSLKDSLPLQQAARGFAGLRALLQPLHHFVHVDLDLHRVRHRVVVPEVLDKAAVARRARVRHHQAVKGVLLRPHPPQPDLYQPAPPTFPICGMPANLPLRFIAPNCLTSFCIVSRARKSRLMSAGCTPLPRAIRRLRAPSMSSGRALSRGVMDRMIASILFISRSVSAPASWPFSCPPPGTMSSMPSSEPMLFSWRIWARKSSKL